MSCCIVKWCVAFAQEGSDYCAVHHANPALRSFDKEHALEDVKKLRHQQRVKRNRELREEKEREAAKLNRERIINRSRGLPD